MNYMCSLREDRFFSSVPFATQETFYNSRFLKLYDKTQSHPDADIVIGSLRNLQDESVKYRRIIAEITVSSDEHDVIRAYTSNIKVGSQTFYNYVNEQLCNDTWRTLRHLMPLIRRATYQINRNAPSYDCVAYRGMKLTHEQRAYFKVGTIFRFPGFTSTSKSKSLAESFGNTLFQIHIHAGCLQVRDVSNISHFPNEEEYLFSPYSLFRVTEKKDGMIVIRSIDNMSKTGMNSTKPVPKDNSVTHSSTNLNGSSTEKSTLSSNKHALHHSSINTTLSLKIPPKPSLHLNSFPENKSTLPSDKYASYQSSINTTLSSKIPPKPSLHLNSFSKNKSTLSSNKYASHHSSINTTLSSEIPPEPSLHLNSFSKNKSTLSSNKYASYHSSITSTLSPRTTTKNSSLDLSPFSRDKPTKNAHKNSSDVPPVTPALRPKKKKSIIRRIKDIFKF